MPKRTLLRNADLIVTMDQNRHEIAGGYILIEDNRIAAVGDATSVPGEADETIDMTGHIVLPGLINTHHHMFQSLTRAVPGAQDAELFDWLKMLYPIWGRLTPEALDISTRLAMAELMLSGCTTTSDHLYLFPNGGRLDDSIAAAAEMGMRFHACRGAMSLGESAGGLPPDSLVENEENILRDMQRVIETFHDPARHSMLRIALAPCSPFSVSRDLMRETASLARGFGVRLHTHLAENDSDIAFSRERFAKTPAQYAEECGFLGEDVWHAHCVKLDNDGISRFAGSGTGVAHCPCSNMRLASGIAPIAAMRRAGVPVGLGVDGSASNDSGHMLGEARQAMLLQRVGHGPAALSAREALEMATLGGARLLGRTDIGALIPDMSADIIAFDLRQVAFAGALHDPVAALALCAPAKVNFSMINGKVKVSSGQLVKVETGALVERHNRVARELMES